MQPTRAPRSYAALAFPHSRDSFGAADAERWAAEKTVASLNVAQREAQMKIIVLSLIVLVLSGCSSLQDRSAAAPVVKRMSVNGTVITYLEQGQGTPVVFVHGAYSDHRLWEPQREVVARRYRFIALDQRYFGTAPWTDSGSQYSQETHVADLAAFIRELKVGPVYVVGRSYGSGNALAMAVRYPELVRGLFLNEPPLLTIVPDPAERKSAAADLKDRVAVSALAKAGKAVEATRLFHDWLNDQPGGFDALAPASMAMHLDNARTVPLHMVAPPPQPTTCTQVGTLKVPITITRGELTRPFFKILAEATSRCIPGSQLIVIKGGRHGSPNQQPESFNEALLAFLAR